MDALDERNLLAALLSALRRCDELEEMVASFGCDHVVVAGVARRRLGRGARGKPQILKISTLCTVEEAHRLADDLSRNLGAVAGHS